MKRAEIHISGFVQGVGYRYFAQRHAEELGLHGYVRNQPEGSVIVVVEGDETDIHELFAALKIGPSHCHVNDIKILFSDFIGEFNKFEARY